MPIGLLIKPSILANLQLLVVRHVALEGAVQNVQALNLGVDSYINKNGSPETVYCELADAINKTLERKQARELLAASEAKYRTLVEKSLQ